MYPTDLCWETGEFTDDCCCDFCFASIVKSAAAMIRVMMTTIDML